MQPCGKVDSPSSDDRLDGVIAHVAQQFALSPADLKGRSRDKEIVRARQLAMWCCRRLVPQPSLPTIGRALNRDHSSVSEAIRVAERLLHEYPALADVVRGWERSWRQLSEEKLA